ncbi:hypothetical protein [uncultured Microbacterium sp.]|uniref:hypothetical protein n=1 Tax=uncultured Microbacterium sp. TaxID=191216 RepID=UPI0025CE1921|nr:hypothetical protein [uncultured Microbacterium sp.]
MTELDFAGPIAREFESGMLKSLSLIRMTFASGGVTIEFTAHELFPGRFRLHVPLPQRPHDRLWDLYDDLATDVVEWTRWGIAVPLREAHETQALSGRRGEDGVMTLHMP